MGEAGKKLVTQCHNWQVKGKKLVRLYEEIISKKNQKILNTESTGV
jgi:hypothetical protein